MESWMLEVGDNLTTNDVVRLRREGQRLLNALVIMREALEYYASADKLVIEIAGKMLPHKTAPLFRADNGLRARQALSRVENL